MKTKLFQLKIKKFESSVLIGNKTFLLLMLFAVAINPNGFSQNDQLSETEKQRIKSEIQQRVDNYCDAFKRMDKKWFRSFFADDIVYAGDGKLLVGYDKAIAESLDHLSENYKKVFHCNIFNEGIRVLGNTAASCAATYHWRILMNPGDTLQAKGSWLYVFEKNGNQWKVVHTAGTHIYY